MTKASNAQKLMKAGKKLKRNSSGKRKSGNRSKSSGEISGPAQPAPSPYSPKAFWDKYQTPILFGVGAALTVAAVIVVKKKIDRAKLLSDVKNFGDKTFPSNTPGETINIVEAAKQIGMDLGFEYSAWNPQSWTENDDAVVELLLKIPKDLIPELAKQYAKEYDRNLQQDLQKYLDDYSEVRNLFV